MRSRIAVLGIVTMLAACNVPAVTFSVGDAPSPPETCNMVGGDAGNGGVNCADPACANTPACTSGCGDDKVEAGEQCDEGGADTQTCNGNKAGAVSCHFPSCGDGYTNTAFTPSGDKGPEECDNAGGGDTQTCNGNEAGPVKCQLSACGDGYKNSQAGEQCDNLGGSDTATCNGSGAGLVKCQRPACGDGYKNGAAGEQCDTAGGVDSSSCNGSTAGPLACHTPRCGDGYRNAMAGESCDGGDADTLTCNGSAAVPAAVRCQPVACGDGHVNTVAGETCDDGNQSTCGTCPATSCKNAAPIAAARASATVTTSAGDQIDDAGDFIRLDDGFGNVLTFEYTTGSTTIPGAFPIPFVKSPAPDGAVTIANNTASAIHNQFLAGFGIDASVPPGAITVTLTNQRKTRFGNTPITFTGLIQFVFSPLPPAMTGGAAGDCNPGVGCVTGDDCRSGSCDPAAHTCK